MAYAVRQLILAAVFPIVAFLSSNLLAQIEGRVTDAEGNPLVGVDVYGERAAAETDAEGKYTLKSMDEVVFFDSPGYQPLTRIREKDSRTVDATLTPESDTTWIVPTCQTPGTVRELVNYPMHFSIPRHQKIVSTFDVDYGRLILPHKVGSKKFHLVIMYGPYASNGRPWKELYLDSVSLRERRWKSGGLQGLDARGVLRDGTQWRYVGIILFESGSYERVPTAAATAFDAILDSMCVKPPKGDSKAQ